VRESEAYQAILEQGRDEGEVRGLHRALLNQGRTKLGDPDEATRKALLGIKDLDRLDRLLVRLLEVANWQELLQTP
jgi:hypothetical protein